MEAKVSVEFKTQYSRQIMKVVVTIVRILVGVLFIFSGLIKGNDPLGLAYKMQEYFDLWHLSVLDNSSLWLSILMIAFEIIAGIALLLGWQMRLFSWLLLLLILFFTFLTGYAYFSGKFTNCGCFGDCIPITPLTSFLKDLLLTGLICFLFATRRYINPPFAKKTTVVLMLITTVFSFGIQWYVLNYLPFIDCLPFKKQNNIPKQMMKPDNAVDPVTAITFVYEKDGQQKEYSAENLPANLDSTYKLIKRYDKVIREGKNNIPPIHDFKLYDSTDEDHTNRVLAQPYVVLLFCENFSVPLSKWQNDFNTLYAGALKKNIPVYIVTTRMDEARQLFASTPFKDIGIFKCDFTAIRTAARTNPCIYLLNAGTITDKQSYHRIDRITDEVKNLPEQTNNP